MSKTDEASDLKFGKQLGFTKPRHKITPRTKVGVALGWGSPKFGGSPLIFVQRLRLVTSCRFCWGLPRPIMKSHPEEKVDVVVG